MLQAKYREEKVVDIFVLTDPKIFSMWHKFYTFQITYTLLSK